MASQDAVGCQDAAGSLDVVGCLDAAGTLDVVADVGSYGASDLEVDLSHVAAAPSNHGQNVLVFPLRFLSFWNCGQWLVSLGTHRHSFYLLKRLVEQLDSEEAGDEAMVVPSQKHYWEV